MGLARTKIVTLVNVTDKDDSFAIIPDFDRYGLTRGHKWPFWGDFGVFGAILALISGIQFCSVQLILGFV